MRAIFIFLLASIVSAFAQTTLARRHQVESVAAFARLYGVVRYFYPGDAAAALDWDRFAVLGISRLRALPDSEALGRLLRDLFTPLGPGIEIGRRLPAAPRPGNADPALVAWRYLGPGVATRLANTPYAARRTNRQAVATPDSDAFVTMMQTAPATELRGKAVRLRGRARVPNGDAPGWAGLWLRVDCVGGRTGFFDNMQNRPVRNAEWREYAVEGVIAEDATNVAFGVLAAGATTADFDGIELAVRSGADTAWMPLPVPDSGFESLGGSPADKWIRAGSSRDPEVSRPDAGAAEGARFLRLTPRSSRVRLFEAQDAVASDHIDFDLGDGLRARVRLALTDSEAKVESPALAELVTSIRGVGDVTGRSDPDVRLADVTIAWNVFRHFYPYFADANVDWDSRLPAHLVAASAASSREAHRRALEQLVADARDGHGGVNDPARMAHPGRPLQLAVVEGRLIVTATAAPAEAPVGAIVNAIDGVPASERLADLVQLASGSDAWRTWRVVQELARCTSGSSIRLGIESPGSPAREISLGCGASAARPAEPRPDPIAELEPGLWYVDLTRASFADLRVKLGELSAAAGIVFDVRGYPTDAGAQILPHLIDAPERDRWMHVAKITGPFGRVSGWLSAGWDLQPVLPHLPRKRVFLTDGRAISYAESVMGYVADRKLGTIVGSATAGTNGNVAVFAVPSGFTISFTGMKVTKHDGEQRHHLVGIQPDVPLKPTLAGVRAGRDELLERGLALLRAPE